MSGRWASCFNRSAKAHGRSPTYVHLSVFATHSLTVRERSDFYDALGMDAIAFDQEVIRQTNNTSARAFPTILNVDYPQFFPRLNRCAERNLQLKAIDESSAPQWLKTMRKLPLQLGIVGELLRLYLIKPIDAEATREMVL